MVFYERADFFQNPEVLAVAVAFLVFMMVFYILSRKRLFGSNKGVAIVISLILAAVAGRELYTNEFYGYEVNLVILIYVAVLLVVLRIVWAFVRNIRSNF